MSGTFNEGRLSSIESKAAVVETRLGYVEARVEKTGGKIEGISERLARLEEKVNHLPTKEQVVKIALGTIAALTAVLVFQTKIQGLLGFAPLH